MVDTLVLSYHLPSKFLTLPLYDNSSKMAGILTALLQVF